ncbi:flagellar biosynthesis protein FlhB [Desulfocucumis palustris]|uniref:Flagellar biosynthetic protein FlhB n=1 Tax=Desulfocucumis palustris TaxID=1898651 RepID=A0A2L2XBY4_9FIRM|nr:flagellar biosynthesis protein FlhB [Desulfocucumis palustris]GBF33203.1 flagellar biosynthesis protein FlhB [Desulfocucumis palustris]
MAESGQQKTEKPTPRRLQESRKKGQVPNSKDLTASLVLLAAVVAFYSFKPYVGNGMEHQLTWYLANCFSFKMTPSGLPRVLFDYFINTVLFLAPIFILLLAVAFFANVGQFGFLFAPEVLTPKIEKLNPINGLKRIFSLRSVVELVKSILKVVIVGSVSFLIVKSYLPVLMVAFYKAPGQGFAEVMTAIMAVGAAGTGAFLVLSIGDMLYQRWEYIRGLRMSKQEIKDEFKQTEGDPQIKGWLKRRQREIAMNRIRQEVPRATMVVTNPIHYAVALRYQDGVTDAPVVVAKGAGDLAQSVKKIARENNIPVVENPPLAQALYKQVDVGREIPAELYKAVAEILAVIYRENNRRTGTHY